MAANLNEAGGQRLRRLLAACCLGDHGREELNDRGFEDFDPHVGEVSSSCQSQTGLNLGIKFDPAKFGVSQRIAGPDPFSLSAPLSLTLSP